MDSKKQAFSESLIVYSKVLDELGVIYKENSLLCNHTYSRTGGKVLYSCFPDNTENFTKLLISLNNHNLKFIVLGNTTNILFLDSVVYSCVIYTNLMNNIFFDGNYVNVECGRNVSDLVRDLSMRELTGAEGLEGIPGTIGGALIMNAGAYGYTISDYLVDVHVLNPDNKIKTISKSDITFKNREAKELKNKIILSARFKFPKGCYSVIEKKVRRFHISRHQYQEWVYPNLGSIFVVPSLNIHKEVLGYFKLKHKWKVILIKLLIKLFTNRFMFILRRCYPEINFQQLSIKLLNLNSYNNQLASRTTINTFTNKKATSTDILNYIHEVFCDTGKKLKIENEIVTDTIYEIVSEDTFNKDITLLKKINNL